VEGAYREGDGHLELDPEVPDDVLDGIAEHSDGLTTALGRLLGDRPPKARSFPFGRNQGEPLTHADDRERRELEAAAFAVAGIDLAVGAAVLLSSREEAEASAAGMSEGSPPPVPSVEELPRMEVLLWKAGQVFGEGAAPAGAQPGPPWVLDLAASAVDELVEKGADPAYEFGKGMLSLGISGLAGAAGGFDPLHRLVDKAWGRLHVGARLLRSALAKLARTVGSDEFLGSVFEEIVERFGLGSMSLESAGKSIFRGLVRADSSLESVARILRDGDQRTDLPALQADLADLCLDYANKMWWAQRAVDLICVGGLVVAIIGLGVGHLALAAAYGIGFTVCLFATADRLDTVPGGLGWVRGVPSLVHEA
jgi:hypothetical protein